MREAEGGAEAADLRANGNQLATTIRARAEREFGLELISTQPNVVYDVTMDDGTSYEVTNPSEFPSGKIAEVREPVVKATILSPSDYIGTIMELCQLKRGSLQGMDYLSEDRVEMRYTLPMGEIVFDFFDQLKSRTKGYASLDYERSGEQAADLVKVDILLQGEPVDAFSAIRHKDAAFSYGTTMATKLRELIRLGGGSVEGPWDGEEGITLLADLDAAGKRFVLLRGGDGRRHRACARGGTEVLLGDRCRRRSRL